MSIFIPIDYDGRRYPEDISPKIKEIAGNFDVAYIRPLKEYSLHTEYSYGKRRFDSGAISNLNIIKESHRDLVPMLWANEKWALEFSDFISKIVGNNRPPKIIEIHPPFNDYCNSIDDFLKIYELFEESISRKYPETEIFIENRYGTLYRGGKFLISKVDEIENLCKIIFRMSLKLRIVLDFPQLFSAYNLGPGKFTEDKIVSLVRAVHPFREFIKGIHLWGKKEYGGGRYIPHKGDLNTYFIDNSLKKIFLKELYDLLDDGIPRYFVPEVNSPNEDLISIIEDLKGEGFKFV